MRQRPRNGAATRSRRARRDALPALPPRRIRGVHGAPLGMQRVGAFVAASAARARAAYQARGASPRKPGRRQAAHGAPMRIPPTTHAEAFREGRSYFCPVGHIPSDQEARERAAQFRAAEELQQRAWALGGFGAIHSRADLLEAAALYNLLVLAWEGLGNRTSEAHQARHMARSCLERAGR